MKRPISAALLVMAFLPGLRASGQVVINEIHAAANERFLRYDGAGQGHLGSGPSWWEKDFAATGWQVAPVPVGFGYPDLATNLGTVLDGNTPSLYLRKTFTVSPGTFGPDQVLSLTVDFNDGFIAWLNGREIARSHTGPPGLFFYADQTALVPRAEGEAPAVFSLGRAGDLLLPGENILAVQVVNFSEDAKGNLRFAATLGIPGGQQNTVLLAEDFNSANGASRTHRNQAGAITNSSNGTPPPGGWLDRSPLAVSSPEWTDLTATTRLAPGEGVSGSGALQYTFTAAGNTGTATLRGPEIDLAAVRTAGALTAADLESLEVSLKYKLPAGFSADAGLETLTDPPVFLSLPALPPDAGAPAPGTVGFWRFEDSGAANAANITSTASLTEASSLAGAGQNAARYSSDVPGPVILDPVSGHAWPNKFSLNAAAANARVVIPDSSLLNSPDFTLEFFIKLTGEPLDFDAFARRGSGTAADSATSSTRRSWQLAFDSGLTSSTYGRIRARWDTPGNPPADWNRATLGGLIFADTPAADGNPLSYGAGDPQAAGDGVNDSASRKWHHVALTWSGSTRQFGVITNYQPSSVQTLAAPFVHPGAPLELGKFVTTTYGLNLDEVRYSSRVLAPSQLLRTVTPDTSGFSTWTGTVQPAAPEERNAFLAALNAAGQPRFRLAFRLRPQSVSATGRILLVDDVRITHTRPVPGLDFVSSTDPWQYTPGHGEPSGGVWDAKLPRETNTVDQQFSLAAFPDLPSFSDWIELYNTGTEEVSLNGFTLTDDAADPAKWAFPQGAVIAPGGYLLVLADDHAGIPGLDHLHANFKLSEGGETLQLHRNGILQDALIFPSQDPFHSFGRSTAGFSWLEEATPGRANSGPVEGIRAGIPRFSLNGGFYAGTQVLVISTETAGASIRYTTDGSEPTATNGTAYQGPLTLAKINEKTGHTIRARAFPVTGLPSDVRTATFLIDQDTRLQSAPALIVTGDAQRDLYRPFGILSIKGGTTDANNIWSAVDAEDYNLAIFHGRAYERSVFVEWQHADGSPGFAEQAGLRLASSPHARPRLKLQQTAQSPFVSTSFEKPSFNLFFRGDYGAAELDYPVLGSGYPVKSFDQLRARAGKNDIINPFIKDELIRRTFIDMGHPVVRGTFNTLYINGAYKGYYNTVERYRAPFFQTHYNTQSDWDIRINDNVEDGDTAGWTALLAALGKDLGVQENYEAALAKLDLDEVIDYFLINIYTAQSDWPNNNWVAARERSPQGRYRLYLWDSEISFAQNANKPASYDTIQSDLKNLSGSLPGLFRLLVASPEIRLRFSDRIQKHFFMDGALDDRGGANSRIVQRKNGLAAEIEPLMQFTQGQAFNHAFLNNWVQPLTGRRYWLFDSAGTAGDVSFRKHGLWPVTPAPRFSQAGGQVTALQGVTLTAPSPAPAGSPVYYTLDGSDPRSFGGGVAPQALTASGPVVLPNLAQVTISARVRHAVTQEWSPLSQATFFSATVPASAGNLVVSQIQYHPPDPSAAETGAGFYDADDFEFIELQVVGDVNVDLSGLQFTAGISFDFAAATLKALGPGERVILARNPAAFLQRYGTVAASRLAGQFLGKLDNSGERLLLTGADGPDAGTDPDIVRDFVYDDGLPWPEEADGRGAALVLVHPDALPDHALAPNWAASSDWAGSPAGSVAQPDWDAWRRWRFSPGDLADAGRSGPDSDPDGDGTANLLEFAIGSHPGRTSLPPGLSLEPVEASGGARLLLSGIFAGPVQGLILSAEASSDLREWTGVPEVIPPSGGSGLPAGVRRQWLDREPVTPGQPRYLRLRVRLP